MRIALAEKKIEYELESRFAVGRRTTPSRDFNPLGKVPVLVLDDGTQLYDSRVIVEYLDTVSPVSRLIPEPSRQRIAVKRWEALADGICDAAAAIVLERKRPARQQSKRMDRAPAGRRSIARVAELARELDERAWCNGEGYSLADIATGCALGYLDLRYPGDSTGATRLSRTSRKLAEKLAQARPFVRRNTDAGVTPR